MNTTNLHHALIAVAVQLLFGLFGYWWAGALPGAFYYVGREIAQAEYRWIDQFGNGKRANMPWWGGFDKRVWKTDAIADLLCPVVAVVTVASLSWIIAQTN